MQAARQPPDGSSPAAPETLRVVCNGVPGIFLLNDSSVVCGCSECAAALPAELLNYPQLLVQACRSISPTEYERHAGMGATRKWRHSIKVVLDLPADAPLTATPASTESATDAAGTGVTAAAAAAATLISIGRWLDEHPPVARQAAAQQPQKTSARADRLARAAASEAANARAAGLVTSSTMPARQRSLPPQATHVSGDDSRRNAGMYSGSVPHWSQEEHVTVGSSRQMLSTQAALQGQEAWARHQEMEPSVMQGMARARSRYGSGSYDEAIEPALGPYGVAIQPGGTQDRVAGTQHRWQEDPALHMQRSSRPVWDQPGPYQGQMPSSERLAASAAAAAAVANAAASTRRMAYYRLGSNPHEEGAPDAGSNPLLMMLANTAAMSQGMLGSADDLTRGEHTAAGHMPQDANHAQGSHGVLQDDVHQGGPHIKQEPHTSEEGDAAAAASPGLLGSGSALQPQRVLDSQRLCDNQAGVQPSHARPPTIIAHRLHELVSRPSNPAVASSSSVVTVRMLVDGVLYCGSLRKEDSLNRWERVRTLLVLQPTDVPPPPSTLCVLCMRPSTQQNSAALGELVPLRITLHSPTAPPAPPQPITTLPQLNAPSDAAPASFNATAQQQLVSAAQDGSDMGDPAVEATAATEQHNSMGGVRSATNEEPDAHDMRTSNDMTRSVPSHGSMLEPAPPQDAQDLQDGTVSATAAQKQAQHAPNRNGSRMIPEVADQVPATAVPTADAQAQSAEAQSADAQAQLAEAQLADAQAQLADMAALATAATMRSDADAQAQLQAAATADTTLTEPPASDTYTHTLWMHVHCACWCPEIRPAGGRVVGVTAALKRAHHTRCCSCGRHGASLLCTSPGCGAAYHLPCAQAVNCVLQEGLREARMICPFHAPGRAQHEASTAARTQSQLRTMPPNMELPNQSRSPMMLQGPASSPMILEPCAASGALNGVAGSDILAQLMDEHDAPMEPMLGVNAPAWQEHQQQQQSAGQVGAPTQQAWGYRASKRQRLGAHGTQGSDLQEHAYQQAQCMQVVGASVMGTDSEPHSKPWMFQQAQQTLAPGHEPQQQEHDAEVDCSGSSSWGSDSEEDDDGLGSAFKHNTQQGLAGVEPAHMHQQRSDAIGQSAGDHMLTTQHTRSACLQYSSTGYNPGNLGHATDSAPQPSGGWAQAVGQRATGHGAGFGPHPAATQVHSIRQQQPHAVDSKRQRIGAGPPDQVWDRDPAAAAGAMGEGSWQWVQSEGSVRRGQLYVTHRNSHRESNTQMQRRYSRHRSDDEGGRSRSQPPRAPPVVHVIHRQHAPSSSVPESSHLVPGRMPAGEPGTIASHKPVKEEVEDGPALLGGTTGHSNGRAGRCAVCVIQRKGKCGTESAPRKCLRRQLQASLQGNGMSSGSGEHSGQHGAASTADMPAAEHPAGTPMQQPGSIAAAATALATESAEGEASIPATQQHQQQQQQSQQRPRPRQQQGGGGAGGRRLPVPGAKKNGPVLQYIPPRQ